MHNKVVIIGCGNVGMSYAYALLNQKTKVDELILIDLDEEKIKGEASDLNHGMPFAPSKMIIRAGNYNDCNDATIICLAAGKNQNIGETRFDLINKNDEVFKSIISKINETNFNGIYLIATNPVDAMTYITMKHSAFDKNRVIGSGTTLDTARLRYALGERLKVNSKNVHAYVLGEHGDSEFTPWSSSFVGNMPITDFISCDELDKISADVKSAAYEIIKQKGSTHYGIGMCLVRITNAILGDENTILTVSSYDEKNDIYVGMPSIVNKEGIKKTLSFKLNEEENKRYLNSINVLKTQIKSREEKHV
ncbi:MAG: L-lactate dehydrogenase [Bacilli bacterium]